jgi:uncharacterized protein YifE (UPF0438 family)
MDETTTNQSKSRREYIKVYKRNRRLENEEYERVMSKNYNRISYDKRVGKINNEVLSKYGILYSNYMNIHEELQHIKLLNKPDIKEDLIKMIQDILC